MENCSDACLNVVCCTVPQACFACKNSFTRTYFERDVCYAWHVAKELVVLFLGKHHAIHVHRTECIVGGALVKTAIQLIQMDLLTRLHSVQHVVRYVLIAACPRAFTRTHEISVWGARRDSYADYEVQCLLVQTGCLLPELQTSCTWAGCTHACQACSVQERV